MCEREQILDRLAAMEKTGRSSSTLPTAIRNTYRHRMIELFARHHVSAPISQVVATDSNEPRPADCAWVKRYDFHATQSDDVMYAASDTGWREALRRFAGARHSLRDRPGACAGRSRQILRRQQAGRRSDACWFQWFYHRDKGMLGHAFDSDSPARGGVPRGVRARASRFSAATRSFGPTASR